MGAGIGLLVIWAHTEPAATIASSGTMGRTCRLRTEPPWSPTVTASGTIHGHPQSASSYAGWRRMQNARQPRGVARSALTDDDQSLFRVGVNRGRGRI